MLSAQIPLLVVTLPSHTSIRANQPIHSFLVGCLNPCLQGTSVRVCSPQPPYVIDFNIKIINQITQMTCLHASHCHHCHYYHYCNVDFVGFHNITCMDACDIINISSLLSCIHVNTTNLLNIMCILVATCVILGKLKCNKIMNDFGQRRVTY